MSLDKRVLEIIACPVCKGNLEYDQEHQGLICHGDRLVFPIKDGIPILLEDEAHSLNASTPEEPSSSSEKP